MPIISSSSRSKSFGSQTGAQREPGLRNLLSSQVGVDAHPRAQGNIGSPPLQLGIVDLSSIDSDITINELRLGTEQVTLGMALPTVTSAPRQLDLLLIPSGANTYALALRPHEPSETELATGFGLSLEDGQFYVTPELAKKLGGFLWEIAIDCDTDAALATADFTPLRHTNTRTFQAFSALCAQPNSNNPAIKWQNVVDLLTLADYVGNTKTLNACKAWLFEQVGVHLASTNRPLFQQRITNLLKAPHHLWADYVIKQGDISRTLPGLARQLLIMAFPSAGRTTPAKVQQRLAEIQGCYKRLLEAHDSGLLDDSNIHWPELQPQAPCISKQLMFCMAGNAVYAVRHLLTNPDNHSRYGLFTVIKKRENLEVLPEQERAIWVASNPFCDAIELALDPEPDTYYSDNGSVDSEPNSYFAQYEVLEQFLKCITQQCGPTVVSDSLRSPRGKALVKIVAETDDARALGLLLKAGAPANVPGVLREFAANGNVEALELLLAAGVSANQDNALLMAVAQNQPHAVDTLLAAGASLKPRQAHRHDSLMNAAARVGSVRLIDRLRAEGCDILSSHVREHRVREAVSEHGRHYLNDYGLPQTRERRVVSEETPLSAALGAGQSDSARHLLTLGAAPSTAEAQQALTITAIMGDCNTGGTENISLLSEELPSCLTGISPKIAAQCLRMAARAENHKLLELLMNIPSFHLQTVKRTVGSQRITAYKIYKHTSAPQPDILAALKPRKICIPLTLKG